MKKMEKDVVDLLHASMGGIKENRSKRKITTKMDSELSLLNSFYSTQEMWLCCVAASILSATMGLILGALACLFFVGFK